MGRFLFLILLHCCVALAGDRLKPEWELCRTSLRPLPPASFASLDAFARAVLTPETQISDADAGNLTNLSSLSAGLLWRFQINPRSVQGLMQWLLSGHALQHPAPSIYGFLRQLLVPGNLAPDSLSAESLNRVNWLVSALSVWRESESILAASDGRLSRQHMELEFYVPLIPDQEVRSMLNGPFYNLLTSTPKANNRRKLASMAQWMRSLGMGPVAIDAALAGAQRWWRSMPDIDLAVHNPAFTGPGDLARGIKPFHQVIQAKSHNYHFNRLQEILDKDLDYVSLGQIVMFPADLAAERIFLIELRGCNSDAFPRAVQEMRPRLSRAAADLHITFQINGDDESTMIRP